MVQWISLMHKHEHGIWHVQTIVHRHGHANRHSCATHRRYSTACPSESIHSPRRMSQQSAAVGRAVPARSEVATQLGGTPGRRARGCGAAPCLTTDGRCTSRMAISCRCAPRHVAVVIPSVRAERGFHADAGHHWSAKQAERRRAATCPWGCRCACTWMHFAFECTAAPMVEHQQRYAEALADVRDLAEPLVGHEQLTMSLSWLAVKLHEAMKSFAPCSRRSSQPWTAACASTGA